MSGTTRIILTTNLSYVKGVDWGNCISAHCYHLSNFLYLINTDVDNGRGTISTEEAENRIKTLIAEIGVTSAPILLLVHRTQLCPGLVPSSTGGQLKLSSLDQKVKQYIQHLGIPANHSPELWFFSHNNSAIGKVILAGYAAGEGERLYQGLLAAIRKPPVHVPAPAVLKHQVGRILLPVDIDIQGILSVRGDAVKTKNYLVEAFGNGELWTMYDALEDYLNDSCNWFGGLETARGLLPIGKELVKNINMAAANPTKYQAEKTNWLVSEPNGNRFHNWFVNLTTALDEATWEERAKT